MVGGDQRKVGTGGGRVKRARRMRQARGRRGMARQVAAGMRGEEAAVARPRGRQAGRNGRRWTGGRRGGRW